jgi:hypothetical protein
MTSNELREALEAREFRFGPNSLRHGGNGVDWYAYRPSSIPARECECNEGKRVQIFVMPYSFYLNGHLSESCEVELCGEFGTWWKLRAYGLTFDETVTKIDDIERKLVAAWNALNVGDQIKPETP